MKRSSALLLAAALAVWAGIYAAGPSEPAEPPQEPAAITVDEPIRTPGPTVGTRAEAQAEVTPPLVLFPVMTTTDTAQSGREETVTVYVTETGSKYHAAGCQYLSKSCIPMELEDAQKSYEPCSKCHPPR